MSEGRPTPQEWGALAAIATLGLALRWLRIDAPPTLAEIDAWVASRSAIGALVASLAAWDSPFGLLQTKLALAVAGDSALVARLPSLLLGIASIGAAWALGRELAGRTTAWLAAALLAGVAAAVDLSVTLGGAAGLTFWALACGFFAVRALDGSKPPLVGLGLSAFALVFSHALGLGFVIALAVSLAMTGGAGRPRILGVLLLAGGAGFVPSWWAGPLTSDARVLAEVWDSREGPLAVARDTLRDLARGRRLTALLEPVAIGLALLGGMRVLRRRGALLPFALLLFVGGVLASGSALWFATAHSLVIGFGAIFAVEGAFALGDFARRRVPGGGLARPAGGLGGAIAAGVVLASTALTLRGDPVREDFAAALAHVRAQAGAQATVVALGPAALALQEHYAPDALAAADVRELRAIEAEHDEVWVLHAFRPAMRRHHAALLVRLEQEFEPRERFAGRDTDVRLHRSKYADVEITAHDLGGGFHWLDTQRGGNVGVLVGDEGLLLVDPSHWGLQRKLAAALAALSDGPPRWVVDSHWHFDHSGGNAPLASRGARIVAAPKARERMRTALEDGGVLTDEALPTVLVDDTWTIAFAGRTVHAFHVPSAHTDGDLVVHFPEANLFHLGDLFVNGGFPYISTGSGGGIDGYLAAQARVLAMSDDATRFIPGHGPLGTRADLAASHAMLTDARERVALARAAGHSLEEVRAQDPLADLVETWGGGWIRSADMAEFIYSSVPASDVEVSSR